MKGEARRIIADEPRLDVLAGKATEILDQPITGVPEVDVIVRSRLSTIARNAATAVRPVDVAARMLRNIADSDAAAEPIAQLNAEQLVAIAEADGLSPDLAVAALTTLRQTITPLIPYYRWEPVPAPVVVARKSFSQAESIRHLVIRSGVELSKPISAGGTILVDDPATYASLMAAAHPDLVLNYRATSERHIAPPKGSLEMAELHSMMDFAIGSTDPVVRKKQLAVALRDDGTLLDVDVVDATDPADAPSAARHRPCCRSGGACEHAQNAQRPEARGTADAGAICCARCGRSGTALFCLTRSPMAQRWSSPMPARTAAYRRSLPSRASRHPISATGPGSSRSA